MKTKQTLALLPPLLGIFAYGCYRIFFGILTNSDVLIEEVWSRALLDRGLEAWHDLLFTFAPAFFPDFFGYLSIKAIFSTSPIMTVYLTTIFQALCLMAGIWMLLISLNTDKIKSFLISLLIIDVLLILSAYYPGMWLFYHTTNDNLSATVLGFYSLALTISMLKSSPQMNVSITLKSLLLFLLNAFAIMNGRLYVLTFVAPAVLTLAILSFYFFVIRKEQKTSLLLGLTGLNLCLSYAAAARLFEPLINPFSTLSNRLGSGTKVKTSIDNLIQYTLEIFTSSEIMIKMIVLFCIIMLISMTYYSLKALYEWHKQGDRSLDAIPFFQLFLLAAIGANLFGPIVAGMINHGLTSFRYYSTLILLPLTYVILLLPPRGFKLLFLTLTLMTLMLWGEKHRSIDEILQNEPFTREALLAQCIDKYAQEYHLELGLSDYWNSYPVAFLSHSNIWINPVCNTLQPCVALDRGSYFAALTGTNSYNFILLSNKPKYEFTEDDLKNILPKPDAILPCEDSFKIYVYDQSRAQFNETIQKAMKPFLFNHGKSNIIEIENDRWIDLQSWKTNVAPDITAERSPGWAYGAYRNPLRPGQYHAEITFKLKTLSPKGAVSVGFGDSTIAFNPTRPSKKLDEQGEIITESGVFTVQRDITVTHGNTSHNWGFWIYSFGDVELQVISAHIERKKRL